MSYGNKSLAHLHCCCQNLAITLFLHSKQIHIIELEKMAVESNGSSWGQGAEIEDIRALRRYNWILRALAFAGEMYVLTVLALVILIVGWFLYSGNFENAIFNDGTSLSCILDGATGEIINVK